MIKQLTPSIYVIYNRDNATYLKTLSYLIVEKGESMLIEPGHVKDFEFVYSDIKTIVDVKTIKHIVYTHPDPDLTASLPLFDKVLDKYQIITEWRTKDVLESYHVDAGFYDIKKNHNQFKFNSGRILTFYPTPFAHYAGSFIVYDKKSKLLFSGDLFGGLYNSQNLFAEEDYLESMSIFHENYMPSSDFIRPVMKQLLDFDIKMICPQHGALLKGDMVKKAIEYLYNLDFYNTLKLEQEDKDEDYQIDFEARLTQILIRLNQIFSDQEIIQTFQDSQIMVNMEPISLSSDLKGYPLWHRFFEIIYAKNGDHWINSIESLVNRICHVYHIEEPQIYQLRMRELKEQNIQMSRKFSDLESEVNQLSHKMSQTQDKLLRDEITGLYKKDMARTYIEENLTSLSTDGFLLNFDIDQIIDINRNYSTSIGDSTIKILSYTINNQLNANELLFRGNGSSFMLLIQKSNKEDVLNRAQALRNLVAKSEEFVKSITISLGIIKLNDKNYIHPGQLINDWFSLVETRMGLAKQQGNGSIVFDDEAKNIYYKNNILLVDEEQININLITHYMENESYRVYHAKNPFEALDIIKNTQIDLVISEINLSKLDGFSLKKTLNENTKYAGIPFIFLSHMKNESLIERANRLNVNFFLKKPFYMVELLGLVKRAIR